MPAFTSPMVDGFEVNPAHFKELVRGYNERMSVAYTNTIAAIPEDVNTVHDILSRIQQMQAGIEKACIDYVDPSTGLAFTSASDFKAKANLLQGDDWMRVLNWPDPSQAIPLGQIANGVAKKGDVFGFWIWEDLIRALRALVEVRYLRASTIYSSPSGEWQTRSYLTPYFEMGNTWAKCSGNFMAHWNDASNYASGSWSTSTDFAMTGAYYQYIQKIDYPTGPKLGIRLQGQTKVAKLYDTLNKVAPADGTYRVMGVITRVPGNPVFYGNLEGVTENELLTIYTDGVIGKGDRVVALSADWMAVSSDFSTWDPINLPGASDEFQHNDYHDWNPYICGSAFSFIQICVTYDFEYT